MQLWNPGRRSKWNVWVRAHAFQFPAETMVESSLSADWTGAQIGNNDTSDDIMKVDLSQIHYLSGPVAVTGAEPGDCLVVDILDGIDPFYSPSRGSSYIDGADV